MSPSWLGLPISITMDIGGTSTDISLIRDGRPEITRSASLETVPIRLPVIDINAIGAGGGSIAWIDDGGALRAGPMSAEAVPGPVCYRRGATLPTVTDANLVLGRFFAPVRLGGTMTLDLDGALKAIDTVIAKPLGLDVYEAAAAYCASPMPISCAVSAWCPSSVVTILATLLWCRSVARGHAWQPRRP